MTPDYLKKYIKPVDDRATGRYKNSFFPFCITSWEVLSDAIKCAPSISRFKSLYKSAHFPSKESFFYKRRVGQKMFV